VLQDFHDLGLRNAITLGLGSIGKLVLLNSTVIFPELGECHKAFRTRFIAGFSNARKSMKHLLSEARLSLGAVSASSTPVKLLSRQNTLNLEFGHPRPWVHGQILSPLPTTERGALSQPIASNGFPGCGTRWLIQPKVGLFS
jgi:hypothetical protein